MEEMMATDQQTKPADSELISRVRELIDTIEEAQICLSLDLEQGVKWLNEEAARDFQKKFPSFSAEMTRVFEKIDALEEFLNGNN